MGVGALDIVAGPVEPGTGGAGAVLVEGASALTAAPATLELAVGLEAEPTALPLGCTLVEVYCKERGAVKMGSQRQLTMDHLLVGTMDTSLTMDKAPS